MFRAVLYPVAFIILGLIYSAYSQSSPCQPAFNIDFDNTVLVTNTLHELGGELRFQNVGMYENQVIDMVVTVARGTSYTTDFPDLNGLSGNFGQINVQNRQNNPQLDGEGTFDFCFTQSNGSSQTITIESFDFTIFDLDGRGDRSFEKFTIDPSQYTEFRRSTNSEVFVQCESNASPPCNPGENICFLSTTSGNAGDNPNNPDDLTPEQQRRSVMFTFRDASCFQATFAQVCNDGPNTCNVGGNLIFAGTASQLTGDCDTPSPTTPSPTTPSPTIRPPTNSPTPSPTIRPPTKNPTPNPTTRVPTKSPTPDPTTQAPVTPNPTPRPPIATPTPNPTTLQPVETPDPTPSPNAMPAFPPPTPVMTPNPTPKDTVPPFQDTRPSYKGDRPTQPTQKSKLYSKKTKSSKGAKSKDMVTTAKSSAKTFKTSKSIRGDKTTSSASSTSKKGKKEKNTKKSKSKLVISPDSEDQTIKSKKEKSMPKAQSKLSMDSRKGQSKVSSKDASTDQADVNDDSSSSAVATIDEINMDSEDVLLISGNNNDSTITTTTTTTTTITTTTDNDNEQELENKEEMTATGTASDGNGGDPSKTSKDTKHSRRRRRRQRSLYHKSIVPSKQRGNYHHIQTISIPVSGWDI